MTSSESYRRYDPRAGGWKFRRQNLSDSSDISTGPQLAIKKGSYNLGRSRFRRIMFLPPDFKLRLRYERRSVLGAGIDCGYERVIYLSRFSFKTISVYPSSSLRLFFFSFSFLYSFFLSFFPSVLYCVNRSKFFSATDTFSTFYLERGKMKVAREQC